MSTRERILDAAEAAFAERGFYGASLRPIGQAVGIANPSLLHHFPSKARLYGAVLERIAASLSSMGSPAADAGDDTVARAVALHDAVYDWHSDHPLYARIVMRELCDNRERSDEVGRWYLAEAVERLAALIRDGQERGAYRPADPLLLLFHLIGSTSYFLNALPTVAGMTGQAPDVLVGRYREQGRELALRALLVEAP